MEFSWRLRFGTDLQWNPHLLFLFQHPAPSPCPHTHAASSLSLQSQDPWVSSSQGQWTQDPTPPNGLCSSPCLPAWPSWEGAKWALPEKRGSILFVGPFQGPFLFLQPHLPQRRDQEESRGGGRDWLLDSHETGLAHVVD